MSELKRCAHCQQLKPIEDFAFHDKVLGTRQKQCRDCMRQFNQESYNRRKTARDRGWFAGRQKRSDS